MLYHQAQAGDAVALNALVRMHMPLVQALSKRFSWQEDAFQAGCMGLVKAIRRFDPAYGVQFSTYAVPVILGDMRRAVSGRESWRTRALLNRVRMAQEHCLQENLREATVQELAQAAGCAAEELAMLLERTQHVQSVSHEEWKDTAPDPSADRWMDTFLLRDMIERLPEDEQLLLQLRFRQGKNQKEVAQMLHTSQAGISRMEQRVFRTLRAAWNDST